jgi:hypothetical protein
VCEETRHLTDQGERQKKISVCVRKRYDTQHNDIQHNSKYNATLTIMALGTIAEHCYAECPLC